MEKYFAAYLVELNKYFVYPYLSYSTNCSDPGGTHLKKGTNLYQVPLAYPFRELEQFIFDSLENTVISYDSLLEPSARWIEKSLGLNENTVTVDLYSLKSHEILSSKPFCLTSKKVVNAISCYPLYFRPIELNVFFPEIGKSDHLSLAHYKTIQQKTINNKIKLYQYSSYFYIWSKNFLVHYLISLPFAITKEFIKYLKSIRE